MSDMNEREKKQLFAGSVPIGLNRNQVVIGEQNFNDNLYLLCTGIVRVQRVQEHAENVLDSGRAMDRVVSHHDRYTTCNSISSLCICTQANTYTGHSSCL